MLIALGGSLYYFVAGLFLAAVGVLLFKRKLDTLGLYALLVFGTLIWSLWEVGLDWWPLAARNNVLFPMGLFLLTPWIMGALRSACHCVGIREPAPCRWSAAHRERPGGPQL